MPETLTAPAESPPSFQPEDVAALFSQDTFIQSPPEERQRLFNAVAGSAYQTLASDPRFGRDSYKAWGEALTQGRKKLADMKTVGESASGGVGLVKDLAVGLGKDFGAANVAAVDAYKAAAENLPGMKDIKGLFGGTKDEAAGEVAKTFGIDFLNGLAKVGETTATLAAKGISLVNKDASIWKLGKGLEDLKAQIDQGKIPVSASEFAPWIQGQSSKLNQFQQQWSKSVDFGLVSAQQIQESAKKNSLTDNPQNAQLLTSYIATRDPAIWEQLRSNMLRSTARLRIDKTSDLAGQTEGSKQFDAMFGEGASRHLESGSDPITIASFVFPALKGAAAGEAAVAATRLGRLGQVAVSGLKQVPTNFALGAAGALAQDPNARAGTVIKQGLETAAGGALIHTLAGTPSSLLKRSEGVSGASGGVSEARSPDTPPDAPVQLQQDAQRTTSITDDQANEIFGGKPDVRILGEEPVSQLSPPPNPDTPPPSEVQQHTASLAEAQKNLEAALARGGNIEAAQTQLDVATKRLEEATAKPVEEPPQTEVQVSEEERAAAAQAQNDENVAAQTKEEATPQPTPPREPGVPNGALLQDHLEGAHEVIEPPKPETPVAKEASEAKAAEAELLGTPKPPEVSAQESIDRSAKAQEEAVKQTVALTQKAKRGDAVSTPKVESIGVKLPPTYINGVDGVSRNGRANSYEGHVAVGEGHVPSPADALPGEIANPEPNPLATPPEPFTDYLKKATQNRWNEQQYLAAQEGRTEDLSSIQRRILGRVQREFEDQNPENRRAARRAEAQKLREERAGKATIGSDLPPEGETRSDDPSVEMAQDKPKGLTNLNVAKGLFNSDGSTAIPHAMFDAAVQGAHAITRHGKDFAKWSADMLEWGGENIRPNLLKIFGLAKDNYYELTGAQSPWAQVREETNRNLVVLSNAIRRSDVEKIIPRAADAADDQSQFAGNRAKNAVRLAFGYKPFLRGGDRNPSNMHANYDMKAASFVLEAGGDVKSLSAQADAFRNASKPKQYKTEKEWQRFKNKWLPMMDYAVKNFDKLNSRVGIARRLLDMERASEVSVGLEVGEVDNYISHRYRNLDQMFGDPNNDGVFGGAGGVRHSRYFSKERTYHSLAEAITDGYDPTSTHIADLTGYRIKAGQSLVRQKEIENRLMNTRDVKTGDFLLKQVKDNKGAVPHGYARMNLAGTTVDVFKPYEGVMKAVYGESAIRNMSIMGLPVGKIALKAEGFIKHGNVVGDTFHAGRVMLSQLAATGRVGWRKGYALLEYTPQDLKAMLDDKQITPEIYKYSADPTNQKHAKGLIGAGMLGNRIMENLDADAVGWVRQMAKGIAGAPGDRMMEAVQGANHYIFQKLTRGGMIDAGIAGVKNYLSQGMDEATAYIKVADEMNKQFGNMGRQGWFRSQTMRDVAQLMMFAPSWTNGKIMQEIQAYGQAAKALKNVATLKRMSLGNSARVMGMTYVGGLLAANALNYAFRGHSTFENEEGRRTSAWIPIPGSEKGGFYFDPLYLAAPVTAALAHTYEIAMTRGRTKAEAGADAFGQLLGNKMSPLLRATLTEVPIPFIGGRDFAGRPFRTDTDRHMAALSNLIPSPIPLSNLVRDHSMKGWEQQAFASVGVHLLPAPTASQQVMGFAQPFRPPELGKFPVSPYAPLRQAVEEGSKETAQKTMIDLARKGLADLDKLDHEFGYNKEGEYKGRTFAGSVQREHDMVESLKTSPEKYEIYKDARKEQRDWAHTYRQWRNEVAPQIREATKAFKEEAKDEGIYVPKKLKRAS